MLVCILSTPQVESQFNFTRKLETINVIPGNVSGNGWENISTLHEQDVSDDGIFQSFTKSNAAYPQSEDASSGVEAFPEMYVQPKEVFVEPTETPDAPVVDSDIVGDSDTEVKTEEVLPETTNPDVETESVAVPEEVSLENRAEVFGFFKTIRGLFPFAQESVSEPVTEAPAVSENEGATETGSDEIPTESAVTTDDVSDVPMVAEEISTEVSPVMEQTEMLPTASSSTEIVVSEEVVTEVPQPDDVLAPLVFTDFNLPPLASGQFITNVQLRLSLGAQFDADEGTTTLSIQSAQGDTWEEIGSIPLTEEVSNALNGGYFLYALPTLFDVNELKDLTLRIVVDGPVDEDDVLRIDALWLEIDTEIFDKSLLRERLMPSVVEGLDQPLMHEILSDTLDFTRSDEPLFVLRYESQRSAPIRFLRNILGRDLALVTNVTLLRKNVGAVSVTPTIDMTNDGLWTIQIPEMDEGELNPGTYTLEITIDEGGKLYTDSFDFQWGLLALNPNKTEYNVGETATIALAALSPGGNTLCDASLAVYIIDPLDFMYRSQITPSGLCNGNNVIDVPDYTTTFTPSVSGTYEVYVEHLDQDGSVIAHIEDTFMVHETQALSIERVGQTRIYPRAPYGMSLIVTSRDGYDGVLTERVPGDFIIETTDADINVIDGVHELSWNITLAPGESRTVTYTYDAPDVSPYLYTLGPARLSGDPVSLPMETTTDAIETEPESEMVTEPVIEVTEAQVLLETEEVVSSTETQNIEEAPLDAQVETIPVNDVEEPQPTVEESFETVPTIEPTVQAVLETPPAGVAFEEHRAWQIASDATGSMIVFWTSGASVPSGWTCISCASTSTFYQRFPLGGSVYGTTGGASTQTHTASASVNAGELANAENNAGLDVSINSHSHTLTPDIGSTTTLPAYHQLRVIQNNSAGDPGTIPAGAVLIFDATLPSGWARYTPLDGRYPRGENTLTSAGTNTHIHSATGTLTAASGSTYNSRLGGTQVTAAAVSHTHTLSTSTPPVNHEPPYIEVIFATSSVATNTPLSAIALWSDTPPPGWLDRSSTSEKPFYNRFVKGGTTYGTTGGAETHTHANMSASSSAAVGTDNARSGTSGSNSTHTHMVDLSNFSTASNTPPYATVIYAKYFGLIPIYTQSAFRWYTNANALTVSDPWPTSTEDVLENEAIDASFTPLKNGDVIRLRLQLNVTNSTTTGEDFKLQYGTTTDACTLVTTWTDVGSATGSAEWIGYNNSVPNDGTTLSTSTLTGTDVLESYEEQNPTVVLPNLIGIGQEGEWDFVLRQNNAQPATNYCFRMVESDGTELFAYTEYPKLITNDSPGNPVLDVPFDNEKVPTTTPVFEFAGTDPEGDDLTYQIQIDDDYTFGSVNVDRNTASHPTQFSNLNTPSDKDPYTNGETIRFTLTAGLTNGTTYYWRTRAQDPTGSNAYGDWSTIYSFTVDTLATTTTWFQTTEEQFDTDTLIGTDSLTTDRVELRVGSTTGTTTSSQIDFLDATIGNAWGQLVFTDDETVGDIKYHIEYFDASTQSWRYIPDADLSGNLAGFDTSPVSLLSLDTDEYRLIRIAATFTNSGGTPILYDWTVRLGYRIDTVTTDSPFTNEKVSSTTPTFTFSTDDPQSDDLVYELQWSTTYAFTSSTTRSSDTHAGFVNTTNGADTSPFTSGNTIQFTIQPADALVNGTTYWWRVRARDPLGANEYSLQTDPQSFTVDTSITVSTWFQTTESQFDTNILSGTVAQAAGAVTVATTSDESLVVYAEGNITTPRYREWDGSTWGAETNALDVGAQINWIVTQASPAENEYITGTLGTDADVNVQVYRNGSWDNLQELTTTNANANMRGFDIAYEQTSGDALVAYCDGDADPSYYIWNGSSWTSGGALGLTSGNTCGWIKLIADPTSDEIIAITRDTSGITYEARVWSGSSWGNGTTWGSMQSTQTTHEGIAAAYEDSGNQAVVAVSNGTNANFSWRSWDGSTWSTPAATVALGDDFEAGTIAADDGTDNMVLCYIDQDNDIGAVRWTGSAWTGQIELETAWAGTATVFNDRPVDCAYEVGGARDGYILVAYSDTTNVRHRAWNGSAWDVGETDVSTIQDSVRVQLRRTGTNLLQLIAYDNTNDRYDYSSWNGSSWTTIQTLETNASVGATPFKEPFMNAARNPGVVGSAVVSPGIDFYDGSGPYWQQLSWTDTESGGSSILYQIEYYDGDSWELVPDILIPGNSTGTSTSPINLANVLPVSTYNEIRPVANLTCNLGTCPTLSDWTVTWAAGITISGTAQAYDQSTNVTSGTVGVALNGVLQIGRTGTISGGTWSIANVNAAPGDIVTVFVSGANDTNEAVAVTRYDGVGDISGMRLYERHLALGSQDATTTPFTNAEIGQYDMTNDEDLFFDLSGTTLTLCADTGCGDAELYTASTTTYRPGGTLSLHDIENNGTFRPEGNTVYVSGSWDNNGTSTYATSTVVFTATSTSEVIDETGAVATGFYNLTFGTTTGSATWTPAATLDVNGNLSVTRGTLERPGILLAIAGNMTIGSNGFITGVGTTTFDGTGTSNYTDSNAVAQNIGRVHVDGTSKTLQLSSALRASSITIGADDTLDVSTGNYGITVLGNFINNNTFLARSGTTTFAGTTTNLTITAGGDAFYNLAFTGAGGTWSFTEADLGIGNDFTMSTGTVTFPTGTTTITGSFTNTAGTFAHNNGTIVMNASSAESLTLAGTAFTNAFYNVRFAGSGSWLFTESNATTSHDFRIAQGTVTFPSGILTVLGDFENTAGTFNANSGTVRFSGASTRIIDTNASFYNLAFIGAGTSSFTDTNVTATEDLTISAGTVTFPSGTFTIGGSIANSGTITHNSGTVLLNSSDTGETVSLGSSSLNNLTFNSATGGWTIVASATTTNALTLTAASAFTLASGQTLSVGGTLTNAISGASTTWTGSTLSLEAGAYTINTKTSGGDAYDTLRIKANTDIKAWNSSAATYQVDSSGSFYSQDHAAVDGDLYIFGGYERATGTEYWSAATDFDGTSLGTTSRQVDVRFASGSSAQFGSSTLAIIGTSTATTTIRNQGSGTYTIGITSGTTTFQYYDFADLGTTGVSFTGTTQVTGMSDGRFSPGTNTGTGITVALETIDANPGEQLFRVEFSTTTAISATNVTQTGGTPSSYWWFRESTGNIDGEAFDADSGDPGSVRWDDSSLSITVSGVVYAADGTTPLAGGTCNGVLTSVRVVVENGGSYSGSCDLVTGAFSIPGVVVVGDPTLTVYLNDAVGGERAVTVTKTPTADITDLDLVVNRVITRHEDVSALTIADMSAYDSTDDIDIVFTAATGTPDMLTVFANTGLVVSATTTFTPGGTVALLSGGSGTGYDGSLYLEEGSVFTGAGTTTYSIGGSFTQLAGATFIPASSTVFMTATTSGKGIVSETNEAIDLNNLTFSSTGGWNLTGNLDLTGSIDLASGTLTGTGNITLTNGSLSGNGLLSLGSGTTTIASTNTLGGTAAWTFANLVLGTGSTTGTTSKATTATATVLDRLTISTGHFFAPYGSVIELRGSGTVFVENGTFVEGTSTVRYSGTAGSNVLGTNYYNLDIYGLGGTPIFAGAGIGSVVLNNLSVSGAVSTTFTLDQNDPVFDVNGNVTIGTNGTLVGSASALFTIGGSWDNNGTFTGSNGTTTFDGAGTHTIAAGASSFSNVRVNASGTITVSESATTTGTFLLSAANDFVVGSGSSLAVGGVFNNQVGGADTIWTGSTLFLYGGGNYTVNASTTNDTYERLALGTNTQIRTWNTSATTIDLVSSASLYSQDHAATNGDLYIFGSYTKTAGTDYWSYATDFDGTSLTGGNERQVDIRVQNGGSLLYTGGGLAVIGDASASTSIAHQGSGTYSFRIGGTASTTFSYYELANLTSAGLTFSGTPNVVTLSYGAFTVGTATGTALTVGGTVIDQNPAKTFTNNRFSTSTAGTHVNVTATGTSVSSWRFTNHTGDIDGEAYDVDPDGDPGYIVWDDSAAALTISGRVYSDEGSTVSSICDGSTNNVVLRVAGLTTYQSTCNAGTGLYSMSGVTYSPGDSLVVYIDGEAEKAAVVTEDPVTNINNLDLYENRVIVRHEGSDALSIADMAVWDSSDDVDIPFTAVDASPDTLTLPANRKLIVWNGKEFEPNGNITISGGGGGAAYDGTLELFASAVFDATGSESHTIGGSLIMAAGATLDDETSTFTFTTTGAARTIDTNNLPLYNLTFNGVGSWTITNTTLDIGNDLTITQGTLTLPTATSTIAGSLLNTGGSFVQNGGWMYFVSAAAESIRTGGSAFGTTTFAGTGSYTYLDTNATSTGDFRILSGTVTAASGTVAIGGEFINSGTFTHNSGTLRFTSSKASTTIHAGTSDLYSVSIAGSGSFVFTDPTESLLGNLRLSSGVTTLPTSTISIAGSLVSEGGTFVHSTGTVLMNSSDTGEVITPGTSTFNNLTIAAPSGGYTITDNATTTANFSLTSASSFTLQSGRTLGVLGVFTNLVGGNATTWSGTTLNIRTGTGYTVNTKTQGGDTYNIMTLGDNTDLRLWNSVATTTLSDGLSSLYSQNNAGINGELYIYGNYTRTTGSDYWNAATEFDGTATTSRAVTVRHAAGATSTFSGGTLEIVGSGTATTTITNQGSGTYAWSVTGGTLNAQNYAVRNANISGLVLSGTTTITSLSNGDFELALNGGALITVSSTTLNYNASAVISGMRFATTTAITGVNIAVVGSTSAAWTLTGHRGNLDGEAFDDDGIDACGSVRWDDSACLLTQQSAYRWRNDDGGEGVPDSEWLDTNWSKRKRITVTNADPTTYTNAVVEITVPYDSDMQADFDDLRVSDSTGVTSLDFVREIYTASSEATIWVRVPSLVASDVTVLYLYYGNGGASYAGVGTTTFVMYDDFEDDNITEYSGDTSLFNVDTTFAYQGTYGLEANNPNDRTTDGIYRTSGSSTVSQGETIRYFQYIDTGAGSGDETCTLFGVQTPGSANNNYAVCLEQFGTDRVSISENVVDNDTSGTILASTTMSFSTGWYEIEIDWGTDDTIDVAVYQNDVLVATTSATDGSYTSGGIGFTYWFQNGGWDFYTSRAFTETEPITTLGYEQVRGGATWFGALNTPASGVSAGTVIRPRFVIENTGLTVSDTYRLMYAAKGASPSCEAVGANEYSAVPAQASCGTSAICMESSTQFTNNAGTTDVLGGEGTFTPGQIIEDPSNTTGSLSIDANHYTEVEYALEITENALDPSYCLRVSDAGTSIDSYTRVAELGLVFEPNITSITFNDGLDITLAPGATTTIYATGTVTDQNGFADIAEATTTMFRSGVTSACATDTNNCYIAGPSSCSYINCSGNSCDIVCRADFYYHADPTDAGSAFDAQSWGAELSVRDQSGYTATQTAPYIDLLTLRALTADSLINYGSLEVNANTGSYNATTTFANIGNDAIDVAIEGTDLTDGAASTIPVGEQIFATSTFSYAGCVYCTQLTAASTNYELDLSKPASTTPGVVDEIYWGIEIPFGVSANAHQGTNIFYAISDS